MAGPAALVPLLWNGARTLAPQLMRGIAIDEVFGLVRNFTTKVFKVKRSGRVEAPQGLTPSKPSNNPSYKPQEGGSPKPSEPSAPSNPKPSEPSAGVGELERRLDARLSEMGELLSRFDNRLRGVEALGSTSSPSIASSLHAGALNSGRIANALGAILPLLSKLVSDKLTEEEGEENKEGEKGEENEKEGTPESGSMEVLSQIKPRTTAEKIALEQAKSFVKLGEYFAAKVDGEVEGMNALDLELSHAYTRYKLDEEKLQTYTVNDKEYTFTQLQAMQNLSTIAPLYKVNDEKLSLSELQAQRLSHWLSREIPMKIGARTEKYSAADIAAYKDYSLVAPTAINLNPVASWDITSTSNPELSAIDAQKLRDTVEAKEKYNEASFDFSDLIDDQIPSWEEVKPLFKLKRLSEQVEEEKRKSNHGR